MKYIYFTTFLILINISCSNNKKKINYHNWQITNHVLTSRPNHGFDNVAVKDPSIVYFEGEYHLFYTAKSRIGNGDTAKYGIGCGYLHAAKIDELKEAERFSIDSVAGNEIIAPQIFYFESQRLWYLIAHTTEIEGNLRTLQPIYLTNPDIKNVSGWSEIKEIQTGKLDHEFWIDFWVICDDKNAYMFYSNQKGSVYRVECPLNSFPDGFSDRKPEVALTLNQPGTWRMFEAAHIYYVKKENRYMALLEGAYQLPSRKGDVDARNRFIFGMTADSLNGKWERIEEDNDQFLADAANIFYEDGNSAPYTQVSHPELIRSGYNQKLEIEDYDLTLLFQTFNGSSIPDTYRYNDLPWELVLMKNFIRNSNHE